MIRVERQAAFWEGIARHPALAGAMMGLDPFAIGAIAQKQEVLPVASEHGGYFFARMDVMGFVAELHTLFTPEGWGREALLAGIEAFNLVWICGFQVVNTFEVEGNPRSRPPRSFGFVQAGDWRETPVGNLRMWTLTRAAWETSPGIKRRNARCQ